MVLPIEIIQTIFLELLTSVCSEWRAIALSTPALWADFQIHARANLIPQLDPIYAWISRAAQSTLSIEIISSGEYVAASFLVVDFLFPIIHRCSFLELDLNIATLNRLLTLPADALRALRGIHVFVKDDDHTPNPTLVATAFQSCSELHTFSLEFECLGDYLEIASFNVPWQQLTTLQLYSTSIPAHECLDIVRRCVSLQECHIFVSAVDNLALQRIIELSHHPAVLPSLHTLHVEFFDSENNSLMFLHALHLPCLRKFQPELGMWTHPSPWSLSVLRPVLCDVIQELDLSLFPIPESLSETLARMPNLKILWLNGNSYEYPEIMRALGEGTIAPRLTTLNISFFTESPGSLLDILEARVTAARANPSITVFTNVTILNECDGPLDEARLLALAETGTQIRFDYD